MITLLELLSSPTISALNFPILTSVSSSSISIPRVSPSNSRFSSWANQGVKSFDSSLKTPSTLMSGILMCPPFPFPQSQFWAFLFVAVLHQEMPVLFINFIQNHIWFFLTINKQSSFLSKKSLCYLMFLRLHEKALDWFCATTQNRK